MKFDLQTHWSYFCRCVQDRSQRSKFLGNFGPPNESKFRFLNILLKSFLWIHINFALYAHCVQYGPQKPNLWAILGPKVSQNSGVWSFLEKFSLVSHQYCFICMLIGSAFRCVKNMGFRGPIFWATLGPQIIKNSVLWSFSQKFSTGFASVFVYMSI